MQAEACEFLDRGRSEREPITIVFLDPPFNQDLLTPVSVSLEQGDWLAPDALIYVETSRREPRPTLPTHWQPYRDKTAGDVRFQLFVRKS